MALDTLTNVKIALLITGTTDDLLLTQLMGAAESFVAAHTGRDFAGGTYTETHPAGRDRVFLQNFPVASVTSLKVDAARAFGSDTVRSTDTFVLLADRGVIESVDGPFLPPRGGRPDDWPGCVQVVYATATGAVPAAVQQAFSDLIGHWYRLAKTAVGQSYEMLATKIDGTGTEKDWPWSLARGEAIPPAVLQLLHPFRVPAA